MTLGQNAGAERSPRRRFADDHDGVREPSPQVITAAEVMDRDPITVNIACSLDELAVLFGRRATDVAIVIDGEGRPVGLISAADVLRASRLPHEPGLPALRAGTAATLGTFTALLTAPLDRLVELFVGLRTRHVVLVTDDGRARGLLRFDQALLALSRRNRCEPRVPDVRSL